MSDVTFLEEKQIIGNNKLEIFKKYDTKCAITDFSILLGGHVDNNNYTSEGASMHNRTGWYWTRTEYGDNDARVVFEDGLSRYLCAYSRIGGCRPALPCSSIKYSYGVRDGRTGIWTIEYGEYPQTIANQTISGYLESMYEIKSLSKTGKKFTTDSKKYDQYNDKFIPRTFEEYEYNGQKYIRFIGDYNCEGSILSDGREVELDKAYWVKVEPIVWLVDEESDVAVTKKLVFAGVQFKNTRDYKGDFENTDIKQFMDNYFSKEIIGELSQTYSNEENRAEEEKKIVRKQKPYDFEFEGVSEEEIIRGAIESNIAVFLHGKSSDGKSARVKQIDPDCEIVYLRNATPDSLNGKSVYSEEKGEMIDIPPSWYRKIKEKCEESPDKLHIVFFDELTNALPSIQGMAFNIILDKEVNGVWKLPSNCRIVAAGNDMNDSLAANEMAEPLFNRFAHVYIETTIDKWLKWAAKPENKIHPSIYAYMCYKNNMGKGMETLRTTFDGSKPNADPRKWEMASKILYTTGKPMMLKGLIGEELTKDFCKFCCKKVITVDIVKKEEIREIINYMGKAEMFATALNLSKCEEKDLIVVRDFVSKLGESELAMFDVLWSKGEEKRLEKIAKLRLEASTRR